MDWKVFNDQIKPLNEAAMAACQERLDNLTKPPGSLGVLESIAKRVAGITGNPQPQVLTKHVVLMAGDHGVCAEGISAFPQEVTPQMIFNLANGGAGINVLSRHVGAGLTVVDVGVASDLPELPGVLKKKVAYGTANMAQGPAMTEEQTLAAIEVGREVARELIASGVGLIGLGELGIGNTTPSSAIIAALSGIPVEKLVGRGTGLDDVGLKRKARVIQKALEVNQPDPEDGFDVLMKVGGLEIAGLVGVILECALQRVPVVIDGLIAGAAACAAAAMTPRTVDYMLGSHLSQEPGHRFMLEYLRLEPMLMLDFRLGEGTGAALGMGMVDAALKILNEMATFADAGVSGKNEG